MATQDSTTRHSRITHAEKEALAAQGLKKCSKCRNVFPATSPHFAKSSQQKDGLTCWCYNCRTAYNDSKKKEQSAYHKRYYQENKKRCKDKSRRSYLSRRNQHVDYCRVYYRQNRNVLLTKKREYAAKYPERVRANERNMRAVRLQAEGKHTSEDVALLLRSQRNRCWWCGTLLNDDYHIDHRIPLSRGGSNYANNLCVACPSCNQSKYNKLPSEWIGRLL
jgi:hypothetical protein